MKKVHVFAGRTRKELLRDPLDLFFCLVFPLVLLVMFSLFKIPSDVYRIENFAPGIVIFAYSFVSMFGGMLMAIDRESSFFARLAASPMTAADFIFGYSLPLLPLSIVQSILFFAAAVALGMSLSWHILLALLVMIPVALFYIGFGLLLGAWLRQKQIGALYSLFVTLSTWLSGMWFDLSLVGKWMEAIGKALPFYYAVDAGRAALNGNYVNLPLDLGVVLLYAAALYVLAALIFGRRMKGK